MVLFLCAARNVLIKLLFYQMTYNQNYLLTFIDHDNIYPIKPFINCSPKNIFYHYLLVTVYFCNHLATCIFKVELYERLTNRVFQF